MSVSGRKFVVFFPDQPHLLRTVEASSARELEDLLPGVAAELRVPLASADVERVAADLWASRAVVLADTWLFVLPGIGSVVYYGRPVGIAA